MNFIEILKSKPAYPGYPALDKRTEAGKIRYNHWVASHRPIGFAVGLYIDSRVGIRDFWDTTFAPSFTGEYPRDSIGRPVHPYAEEIFAAGLGIEGPGAYWNYGPNHCADPIVLGESSSGKLKTIVVERKDTGSIALPGGHCDLGEKPLQTAARELHEETSVNILLKDLFRVQCVFEGIVPDARTTINAWPETSAIAILLHPGAIDHYHPKGQDDAARALQSTVNDEFFELIDPAHAEYVRLAVKLYEAETGTHIKNTGTIA